MELTSKCIGCGICAYVCPSCHCFDIVDEGYLIKGTRHKNWDSCCFANFTLHASGHNPRPNQPSRYRQRLLHKLNYYPFKNNGQIMCTGCGRCVVSCPVNIDIYHVALQIHKEEKEMEEVKR